MGKLLAEELSSLADSALRQITPQPLAAVRLLGELLQSSGNGPKQVQPARPLDQHVYHRLHPLHVHRVSCPSVKQPVRGQTANAHVKADNHRSIWPQAVHRHRLHLHGHWLYHQHRRAELRK